MARGGLIDITGNCVAVVEAASGKTTQYVKDSDGSWVSFIPDPYCVAGDRWTGSAWIYRASTPAAVTQRQVIASFAASGLLAALTAAISAASTTNKNAWTPPNVTATDPVIVQAQTNAGLTATQLIQLLAQAVNYPA